MNEEKSLGVPYPNAVALCIIFFLMGMLVSDLIGVFI